MGRLRLMAAGDIWLQTGVAGTRLGRSGTSSGQRPPLWKPGDHALKDRRAARKHHVSLHPRYRPVLVDAGFDILSVANNHSTDLGAEGLRNTLHALESRGILPIGASASPDRRGPVILERNGVTIGFAGYTTGRIAVSGDARVNRLVEEEVLSDIEALAGRCDHIAISLHWGTEMACYPSPRQIGLAHRLIDAGATLILGHHPHTMQAVERYRGGLIAYSLGMFQFDPHWPHNLSPVGFILSVDLQKGGVIGEFEVIPIIVDDDFVPRPGEGTEGENIRAFITGISRPVAEGGITWARWFEEIAPAYMKMNLESYRYRIRRGGPLPFLEMGVWLCTPFCLGCYVGLARRSLRPMLLQGARAPGEEPGS